MIPDPSATQLRRTARDLVRIGAVVTRKHFGQVRASRKLDNTPVTEADHAAQAAILAELAARHGDHAVLTEEVVARPAQHAAIERSRYCWIIDPLDGTRNFSRGLNVYAVSVGVLRDGHPVAGAIYDAALETIWSAAVGEGAFRDDQPLHLEDRPIGADTTIAVSSFRRRPMPPAVRAWMNHYLFRNLGAVAVHLAWVAGGLIDAAYAAECKPWDITVGGLLVQQAGGLATDDKGTALWPIDLAAYQGQDTPILAATPTMHRRLLETLRS